jgi:hypothetical protein
MNGSLEDPSARSGVTETGYGVSRYTGAPAANGQAKQTRVRHVPLAIEELKVSGGDIESMSYRQFL